MSSEEFEMRTYPKRCVGCRNCQLICSFVHEEKFSTSNARIIIERTPDETKIGFREECTDCGTCADYCLYNALERVEVKKE